MHLALQDRHLRISYYDLESFALIGSLGYLSIETQQTVVRDIVTLDVLWSSHPPFHPSLHPSIYWEHHL